MWAWLMGLPLSAVNLFAMSLGMPPSPKPNATHRAEADILESIQYAKRVHDWINNGWEKNYARVATGTELKDFGK